MGIIEDLQVQAQALGAQAAQGALQQAEAAIPGLAQQAQEHLAAQMPALQQVAQQGAHAVGREAGAGAREGLTSDFSSGEIAILGAGAVAVVGLLGFAAYKTMGPKPMTANALWGGASKKDLESAREETAHWVKRHHDVLFELRNSQRNVGVDRDRARVELARRPDDVLMKQLFDYRDGHYDGLGEAIQIVERGGRP